MGNKTLKDIANELGISKGTVDRAVHNRPDVSPETKEKVLKLIEKYNYKPNKAARLLSLKSKKFKYGVILQTEPEFFWKSVKSGIKTAESELSDFGTEIIYKELKQGRDSACTIELFDELVAENVDAIVVVPRNSEDVREKINQVSKKGITVVTLNDDIKDSDRIFYVGPQMKKSGRIAGELMGKLLKTNGKVLTINGGIESLEYQERLAGFNELVMEKYSSISIIANYTYNYYEMGQKSESVIRSILEAAGEIDGIYDVDGASLYNLGCVVRSVKKLKNTVLIGHEISDKVRELMEEGTIYASISQDPYSQGYYVIKLLHNYISEGKKPEYDRMHTRMDIIFKENMTYNANIINPFHI